MKRERMEAFFLGVQEEHLDEASFLWMQWESSLDSSHYNLREVATVCENRLLAHIDGLALGGRRVLDSLLMPALKSEEAERVLTAAFVLLRIGETELVLTTLMQGSGPIRSSIRRALELTPTAELMKRLLACWDTAATEVRVIILEVLAFCRVRIEPAVLFDLCRQDEQFLLLPAALRMLRTVPSLDGQRLVHRVLPFATGVVLGEALETGLVLGMEIALRSCKNLVERGSIDQPTAFFLIALSGGRDDIDLLQQALADRVVAPSALWALGHAGTSAAAEACLDAMASAALAPLASEAFTRITGFAVPMQFNGAQHAETKPADDDSVAVPMNPEHAHQSVPDHGAARAWWGQQRYRFLPHTRYLYGLPLDLTCLRWALTTAPTRRRHTLSRELTIRTRGAYQVETRALTKQQHAQLGQPQSTVSCELPDRLV